MKVVVALALACIMLLSGLGYMFFSGTRRVERNIVGVINVVGPIISSYEANWVAFAINRALLNGSVKAVVLRIDSPGGYAHLIEQIYLDVLELKRRKPVVSSVVTALSGGYYIAVAADYIYAHPTSMVGNVGVVGVGPQTLIPSESVLETGPYKATGFSKLLFPFNLTHALDSFVSAVEAGRGTRLRLSSTELRRGMIYLGSEALAAGLADEVGALQSAVEHVAGEAGIVVYDVVEISPSVKAPGPSALYSNETEVAWRELTVETLNRLNPPPALYHLYLPPSAYMQGLQPLKHVAEGSDEQAPAGGAGGGVVVVDLSHGNKVSMWVLDTLAAELAIRGVALGFAAEWEDVESALDEASGLIVAAPTEAYSSEEREKVEEFVADGRLLLLFSDPASEYMEVPALLGPINSLANHFGLSFAKGYLYDEEEHYGLYRNIHVRQFANTSLTGNLDGLVLFTATHVRSNGGETAWTSGDTYSSTAERTGVYAPIAQVELNGTVAAFGDLTFLVEPYCYVEDNYQLILNLVSALAAVEMPPVEEVDHNVTEPDLPVGTEKVFTEQVDDDEHELRWIRVSENETRVERPDRTTHYHYDVNGSLVRWEMDGMKAAYDEPLPDLPYPLFEGKGWACEIGYNLTRDGDEFRGRLRVNGWVQAFQTVEAGDGESYLCAKLRLVERDELLRDGSNITAVTEGYSWVSSEVGIVKAEDLTSYYFDGHLAYEETRKVLMISIKKGEG